MSFARNLVCGAVVLTLVGARAEAQRVTRGDAEAVLNAYENGGGAVSLHGGRSGPFAEPDGRIAIKPYFEPGGEYCVADWHTIMAIWLDLVFEKPAHPACQACLQAAYVDPVYYSREELAAAYSQIDTTFTLDGAPLAVSRGELKPINHTEFLQSFVQFLEEVCSPCDFSTSGAWGVTWGRVIGPDEGLLGVGEHTLGSVITLGHIPASIPFETTFSVGSPDSAICTQ